MVKDVDLLSYWMPALRKILEFKEIALTEEEELRSLLEATERTINNLFIETADEYGIKKFEDMMGITPEMGDTLSIRRSRVLTRWASREIYTSSALHDLLTAYCGEGKFNIEELYNAYVVRIIAEMPVKGSMETVHSALREILPCNLELILNNSIKEGCTANLYAGGAVSTSMVYTIPYLDEGKLTADIPLYSASAGSVGVMATVSEVKV